jgi:plasmid stability protein
MAELLLTDVEDAVLDHLQRRARAHQRTPAEEAKSILSDVLNGKRQNGWEEVDAIYGRLLSSGKTFEDSAIAIREDRDR